MSRAASVAYGKTLTADRDLQGRRNLAILMASALGWGIGLTAFIVMATWTDMGSDAGAYWNAAARLLAGEPLYQLSTIASPDAYFYPPLFAQMWTPFTVLPLPVFVWLWRAVEFAGLRYLAGSWRNTGLWLLLPLTITELAHANVTFVVAAMSLAALRGREYLAPWAGALKFGPMVLLPYLWLRGNRRSLLAGVATLGVALGVSVLVSPEAWGQYGAAMIHSSGSGNVSDGLLTILPSVGADFALRFGLGVVVCLVAAHKDWPALAYAAACLAAPTLWTTRLVPLLALWRFGKPNLVVPVRLREPLVVDPQR